MTVCPCFGIHVSVHIHVHAVCVCMCVYQTRLFHKLISLCALFQ